MNELNRASYNSIASQWDEIRISLSNKEAEYLKSFVEALPKGTEILDLGCGTGRPFASNLLSRGFRLTGVDQSEGMLAYAQSRNPEGSWFCSSIEEFQSATRFSGVLCWDALFHIPRERHPIVLDKIKSLLRPDGRFLLTCGGSEHAAFQDEMLGRSFFYDSFSPERLKSELIERGFEIVRMEFLNPPTDGRDKGRIVILCKLSSQDVEKLSP